MGFPLGPQPDRQPRQPPDHPASQTQSALLACLCASHAAPPWRRPPPLSACGLDSGASTKVCTAPSSMVRTNKKGAAETGDPFECPRRGRLAHQWTSLRQKIRASTAASPCQPRARAFSSAAFQRRALRFGECAPGSRHIGHSALQASSPARPDDAGSKCPSRDR